MPKLFRNRAAMAAAACLLLLAAAQSLLRRGEASASQRPARAEAARPAAESARAARYSSSSRPAKSAARSSSSRPAVSARRAAAARTQAHGAHGQSGGGQPNASQAAPEPELACPIVLLHAQKTFEDAAREFDIPADLLIAIACVESRDGRRSGERTVAGCGVMNLHQGCQLSSTLDEGAKLLGVDARILKADSTQNVRAAAALLKAYYDKAKELDSLYPWLDVATRYSGFPRQESLHYLGQIEHLLHGGARFRTALGETLTIQPKRLSLYWRSRPCADVWTVKQ